MNEEEQRKAVEKRAVLVSTAVMLYIIGVAAVIIGSVIGEHLNNEDIGAEIGVITMFVLAAVATGLIVYANMTVPKRMVNRIENHTASSTNEKSNTADTQKSDAGQQPVNEKSDTEFTPFNSLMKLYWLVVTIVYLGVSFLTMKWYITWLIWLIAAAVEQGIKIIHAIVENK